MKRTLPLLAALTLVAAVATAQEAAPKEPAPKIAATINGEILTVDQLNRMYETLDPMMRENYDRNGGKLQFLETYIRKRLLVQQALKENFHKRPEIVASLDAAREQVLFDRYIKDVIASDVIPEAELRSYYEENRSQFLTPALAKVRHILITPQAGAVVNSTNSDAKTKEEAKELIDNLARKLDGSVATFADLAIKFSEDGSARSGGDLGWIGRGRMVEPFDRAAFSLKKGETSPVFETEFGYHVAFVEDQVDARYQTFEEVRDLIRERVMPKYSNDLMQVVTSITTELRQDSAITIYRENL